MTMPTRTNAPAMPTPVLSTPKSSAAKLTVCVNSVLTNAALIDAAASRPSTRNCVGSSRSGGAHQPCAEIRRASTPRTGQRNNQPNQGIVTPYSVDSTSSSPSGTTVRRYAVNGPCACVNRASPRGLIRWRGVRVRAGFGLFEQEVVARAFEQRPVGRVVGPAPDDDAPAWLHDRSILVGHEPARSGLCRHGRRSRATRSSSAATARSTASSPSRGRRTPSSS